MKSHPYPSSNCRLLEGGELIFHRNAAPERLLDNLTFMFIHVHRLSLLDNLTFMYIQTAISELSVSLRKEHTKLGVKSSKTIGKRWEKGK